MELNKEQKDALKRLLQKGLVGASGFTNAVYVTPAQQLRNRANEMEQEERDTPLLREILELLNH